MWMCQAKIDEREASKAELLKHEQGGIAGRTKSVLERHFAGEEEEAPDHYQVLGVSRHASEEEIQQAYRALSKWLPQKCDAERTSLSHR